MPSRIETYRQAFSLISVEKNDKVNQLLEKLESEGRNERSICFAIWKSQDKLMLYRSDSRFYSILENEIRKWSWGRDDPRWKLREQIKESEKVLKELWNKKRGTK